MALNITRFESDLDDLKKRGFALEIALNIAAFGKDKTVAANFPDKSQEEVDAIVKAAGDFGARYEVWYSEALAVIRQLLPDRLEDFKSLYEVPKGRREIGVANYVIRDAIQGVTGRLGDRVVFDEKAAITKFKQQRSMIDACKKRLSSSLFDMQRLVQADLFDDEIDTARELLKNKFVRAAGAVAGVVLERHLKQVCSDHNVKVKPNPTLSVLNDALKTGNVIDQVQWRFNQHLGDIRNGCDHARTPEPTAEQVRDLIDGTSKVMKTIA